MVTIEEESRNFEMLTTNVSGHDQIILINVALHAEEGRPFELVDRCLGAFPSLRRADRSTTHLETVIQQDVADRFPCIVKMDIESGEHVLLSNRDAALGAAWVMFIDETWMATSMAREQGRIVDGA